MKKQILLVLFAIAPCVYAQQKEVFCATSISYNSVGFMSDSYCQLMCREYTTDPLCEAEGRQGWKIDALSPREVPVSSGSSGKCTCIGQQYILSKVQAADPNPARTGQVKKK